MAPMATWRNLLYRREDILADVLRELQQLADDWEYEETIGPQTAIFTDLGLESLDVVILSTAAQERYGRTFPFSEFFADLGQQDDSELTVGLWTDFIYTHLNAVTPAGENNDQNHAKTNAFNRA